MKSSAKQILKQAIEDGAHVGTTPRVFGSLAASWSRDGKQVAIADGCGWWTVSSDELKQIVAAMPNDQELSHAAGDIRQPETRSAN